jgi:lysophospholipase L1-like esterase
MGPTATVTQNVLNKQNVRQKARSGAAIKIACEGTSLTYGEDIKGTDTTGEQPGFTDAPVRAKFQYPSSMVLALNSRQITLSLRGYPGDRTTEAITRWQDSTSADICIIEYGTNDAYNFAGYPSGPVPVSIYKSQLELLAQRRVSQGAWVVLCLPPYLQSGDKAIEPYRNAAKAVAAELLLDVFDIEASISALPAPYSDPVHLNSTGYRKWGVDISATVYALK